MWNKTLLVCSALSLALIAPIAHAADPSPDVDAKAVQQEAAQLIKKLARDVKNVAGGTQLEGELLTLLGRGEQQIERSRSGEVRDVKREFVPTKEGGFASAHIYRKHGKATGQIYFQDGKDHALLNVSRGKPPKHLHSGPLATRIQVSRNNTRHLFGTDFQVITHDPAQGEKIINVRAFGNGVVLQDTGTATLKQAANLARKWTTHLHIGNVKVRVPSLHLQGTTALVARGVQKLRARIARAATNHR